MPSQHIILFYKYHPLADQDSTKPYKISLENLCGALELTGRILVGYGKTEGLNGTLAGSYAQVLAFTYALLGRSLVGDDWDTIPADPVIKRAVEQFRTESTSFFESIREPELFFNSPDDFKWSNYPSLDPLFPDLNIKLVPELIGTGGALTTIPLDETAKGYLTPEEWHAKLCQLNEKKFVNDDTILIDCRNTKEYEIGHFLGATDPNTTTFSQFPKWVEDHRHVLSDKKVMMYCTGGIRCEKASAYIRRSVPSVKSVHHLKGGIHKYLEQYGDSEEIWKGRNFVFDGRGAAYGTETKSGKHCDNNCKVSRPDDNEMIRTPVDIVGRCIGCDLPFDVFEPFCVCTVCREPTLVCYKCQSHLIEYHCRNHSHLRRCYFSDLSRFSSNELEPQLHELRSHLASISIGRRFKQKRKTILKQIDRVNMRLADIHTDPAETVSVRKTCRNCGDIGCSGRCWGFYGLKRKERLENLYEQKPSVKVPRSRPENKPPCVSNKLQKDTNLFLAPPNCFRDERSEIRIPPCMTRILSCQTKAKWCGHSVLNVVQREFIELSKPVVLNEVISNGLLRLNGQPLSLIEASETQLKSSDSISRVIHWHEAPIEIPGPMIQVQRHVMPRHIMCEYNAIDDDEGLLFVCNKPSTVPVHPSGPYLLNTLAIMVEAQEKLEPLSLNPLHRTDRVTSGITICSPSPAVSRVFHRSLSAANVHKLYLAKVHGCFPASNTETEQLCVDKAIGRVSWSTPSDGVAVDAPIHTIDAANGHRIVDAHGKASQSIFRLLEYHCETDTSLISCYPITGRNHQLRVHLQWLGFPIVNDVKYGGRVQAEISKKYDALSLMMDVSNSAKEERKVDAVSDDDVVAAKRACACCRGMEGLMDSFTPAQLLEQGHKIFLHALRYRILVLPRKKKTANDDESIQSLAELSFEVDPPTWVNKDALQQSDLDEYWRSIRNSFD